MSSDSVLIGALGVVAIFTIGMSFRSCSEASEKYYAAQSQCVDLGGSWIPTGSQGSFQGLCLNPKAKAP